ncbi:FlaG/FlaF family flagellin (archaellin) [Methanomicrobium sp. W14]|nr:FlaG/FlaF family flagellin (archaellin) [Methanomicrobium sp. W14]
MKNDSAVSPVVGVMLMLVVTIIIATVVSGFAGGLVASGSQKSPALSMDVKITNSGTWTGSGFSAVVTGVSEPIQTSDLKIVTSWKTKMKYNYGTANEELEQIKNGTIITGGNTSAGRVANVNVIEPLSASSGLNVASIAPYGSGLATVPGEPAVSGNALTQYKVPEWQFGNYTLTTGVSMSAKPYGELKDGTGKAYTSGYGVKSPFAYTSDSRDYTDPMQAVLGYGWEELRSGDTVSVKVVFVPTGKTVFSKDIPVTEG